MFKCAATVTAFFLSVFTFSQEYILPNEIGEDFVFFKDNESKIHILKNNIDYVFENNEWRKNILDHNQSYRDSSVVFYAKRFDNISFKAINTDTQTFLVLNGGGPVLQVEKDKIFRIDNSVEQKNQIGAFVFQHNNSYICTVVMGFGHTKTIQHISIPLQNNGTFACLNPLLKLTLDGKQYFIKQKTIFLFWEAGLL